MSVLLRRLATHGRKNVEVNRATVTFEEKHKPMSTQRYDALFFMYVLPNCALKGSHMYTGKTPDDCFFAPEYKCAQFEFTGWIFLRVSRHGFGRDIIAQLFISFRLCLMLKFYQQYWLGHHSVSPDSKFFSFEYESVFSELEIALMCEYIPPDKVFPGAHPIKRFLLDYSSVGFFRGGNNWKSRFVRFDKKEKRDPPPREMLRGAPSGNSPESSAVEVQEEL